jgi:hypothetical protein
VTEPLTSERNFTPTSTAAWSGSATSPGVDVGEKIVHGQMTGGGAAAVVNDHEDGLGIVLPGVARSVACTLAVWAAPGASGLVGRSVAVRLALS